MINYQKINKQIQKLNNKNKKYKNNKNKQSNNQLYKNKKRFHHKNIYFQVMMMNIALMKGKNIRKLIESVKILKRNQIIK